MRRPFKENWILTQGFGENPSSYAKFGMKGHNGLDYGLPTGTNVLAPHAGKVVEVSNDPTGYGVYVKIESDKEGSVLAHLKDTLVPVGATVTEGQLIAHSNNTGNSTGPHLHWGYYKFPRNRSNGYAGFIDQAPLLPPRDETSSSDIDVVRKERDANWALYIAEKELTRIERVERNKNWELYQTSLKEIEELKKNQADPKYKTAWERVKQVGRDLGI